MRKYSAKILSLIGSLFVASSAYAWTPTAEVVRTPTNVKLRLGGYQNINQVFEYDWSSFHVGMMLGNTFFPGVESAVTSMYLSSHPAMTTTFNGHVEFDINLAAFGLNPLDFPTRIEICKQQQYGGECVNSENLVLRKAMDLTANATCYPDPTCATGSGPVTPASFSSWIGGLSYTVAGLELQVQATTVLTGFRAVVRGEGAAWGPWNTNAISMNIYSSMQVYTQSPTVADVLDRGATTIQYQAPFGVPLGGPSSVGYFITVQLNNPITLQPGNYLISPLTDTNVTTALFIRGTTVDLGSDYQMDTQAGFTPLSSYLLPQRTLAIDLMGY